MRRIVLIALLLIGSAQVWGQSCTSSTCTALSPSESDVLNALPSAGNTNSTVTVTIPAGTSNWTNGFSYTIPSAVTNLIIQGQTVVSCTGTPGTNTYNCSATDNTVISDSYQTNNPLMNFITGGTSTSFRVTGISIQGGSTTQSKYNGWIGISAGNSQNVRIDHNHFNQSTYPAGGFAGAFKTLENGGGNVAGVVDHNLFDMAVNNTTIQFGVSSYAAYNDGNKLGDGTFANPTPWGQIQGVFFIESNVFHGGAPNDVGFAGSQVVRYNTIDDSYVGIQTHGTKSQGGPTRGARSIEGYHNYFFCTGCSPASALLGTKGGPAMFWGNVVSGQPAYRLYQGGGDRQSGDETETNPPNGWGYCGTAVNGNGVGSAWDGNVVTSSGYPCLDGLGRGQDVQPLNGQVFNNNPALGRLNTVTGTIAWSQQRLEPQYFWNNALGGIAPSNYMLLNDGSQNNVDYYYDCTAQTVTGCNGSFTGQSGTGYGTLASRPATCTAGINDSFHASPTGHYGVFYFATDVGANGTGYVCSATNVWTPIYQPAPYPHPLAGGGSPTTFTLTVNAVNGTVNTSNNCAPGVYNAGTVSTCTATPNAGYNFTTWTATGAAASCNGTSGVCSFTLNSNASLTPNFVLIVPQLSAPLFTPGSGTYVSAQNVVIYSPDTVINTGITMTEGSNSNASNGTAPVRDAYTNCATSCSAGVPQPPNSGSVSHGQLWCNASQIVSCGSFGLSAVTSTLTGTGVHQLDNGLGAGGFDSLASVTVTYGGSYTGACPGMAGPSMLMPNVSLLGGTGSPETLYSGTTASSNANTSVLAPSKHGFTSGDSYNFYIVQGCRTVPNTSITGFNDEFDLNHTLSTHDYVGPGLHYKFSDNKLYYCFQGCAAWAPMNEVEFNGTVHTTVPFPASHDMYSEFYYHRTVGCSSSSGSNCEFIDNVCWKDFTAGTAAVCYALVDAGTGLAVGGIPVNKPSFPPEINTQEQMDFNQTSVTGSVTVHYKNAIAFNITAPTICVTLDGSTPTGNAGSCTHGTQYTAPIPISSNTTVKSIATESGFTTSPVSTAVYTFSAGGAITVIGTASSGTSNSPSVTKSVTAGNAIYVSPYSGNGAGQTFGISDTMGASWTFVATASLATDNDTIGLYCAIAPATGSMTVTANPSLGQAANRVVLTEVSGSTCSPVQLPVSLNTSAASACSSGPMTTTTSPLLLIGVCGTDGSQTSMTAGSGWSNGVTASNNGAAFVLQESRVTSGTGSFTATSGAFTGTGEQGSLIAAFAPSGGVSNYVLTVTTVGAGTVTGTNCTSGTYPANTPIGACTAVPNDVRHYFVGWSGGTCVGKGTCGPFNLPGNVQLTATFGVVQISGISVINFQ